MDLPDRTFWMASEEEIKRAETSDIYFIHASEVVKNKGGNPRVVMEVYARSLPGVGKWGVLCGTYEVLKLLKGLPVSVWGMEEGEIFLADDRSAVYEPVLQVEANYVDIASLENPILGFLCMSSGISTRAARIKMAAGEKTVLSFGTRRAHPCIAPMVERSAYIGGFDGLSNILGARLIGISPVGTMPHAMVQCFGDQRLAWLAFDEVLPREIPRIVLIDTFGDEKQEAIMALETLGGRLYGVRIDTPSSRRGSLRKIVEEVKWELGVRGAKSVRIFVSGGLDEEEVRELRDIADGFGVGTSVSGAPVIDFSMKIVEVRKGNTNFMTAKKGDLGGRKSIFRKVGTISDTVKLFTSEAPYGTRPLLKELIRNGEIVTEFKGLGEIRASVLQKIKLLMESEPSLKWEF